MPTGTKPILHGTLIICLAYLHMIFWFIRAARCGRVYNPEDPLFGFEGNSNSHRLVALPLCKGSPLKFKSITLSKQLV